MRAAPMARLLIIVALQAVVAATAWPLETTVGGRRIDLDGTFSVREVAEANGATKHERTQEQLRLHTAVSLADWLRFEAAGVGTNGGPTLKADRAGAYTWDDVFQDISPAADLDEAYFDVFLPSVDLRIGKQKVAWGKLDRTQPNDLINPTTYFDPFVEEEAERKIGVPALQASYYLPQASIVPEESRLTAVWVPKYIPYRFPLASCTVQNGVSHCDAERWFPPAGIPVSSITIPAGVIPLPPGVHALSVPLGFRVHNGAAPAWNLANSEIGVRYSALVHDVDAALYYFHGFDVQPAFNLTADAVGQADPSNPLGVKSGTLSGLTTLSPEFRTIDSWGADFAYAFDRFTVRGEGAYISGRPFAVDLRDLVADPRQLAAPLQEALGQLAHGAGSAPVALPPAFVTHDSAEWGIGADYVNEGYMLLLQVNQTDVLHNDANLLIKNVETRLLANLRKAFLTAETLQAQLVAMHAIESDYTLVRPTLRYKLTDDLSALVGYLYIAGRAHSLIGEYRRNDEGYVRVEYKL
ncbi:MAG: DUF1302 family protein [Candidatus Binatia bacterium]